MKWLRCMRWMVNKSKGRLCVVILFPSLSVSFLFATARIFKQSKQNNNKRKNYCDQHRNEASHVNAFSCVCVHAVAQSLPFVSFRLLHQCDSNIWENVFLMCHTSTLHSNTNSRKPKWIVPFAGVGRAQFYVPIKDECFNWVAIIDNSWVNKKTSSSNRRSSWAAERLHLEFLTFPFASKLHKNKFNR